MEHPAFRLFLSDGKAGYFVFMKDSQMFYYLKRKLYLCNLKLKNYFRCRKELITLLEIVCAS